MTKNEINEFVESMKELGDEWTEEQVIDVYGDKSLDEALSERKNTVNMLLNNIAKIVS